MLIRLNMTGDTPIYQQLRNEIVLGIGTGQLPPGTDLPTVRQLAADLGINPMTVNKAYGVLKEEGFIDIDRRRGAVVSPHLEAPPDLAKRWRKELALLIAEAKARGMESAELLQVCADLFQNPKGGNS